MAYNITKSAKRKPLMMEWFLFFKECFSSYIPTALLELLQQGVGNQIESKSGITLISQQVPISRSTMAITDPLGNVNISTFDHSTGVLKEDFLLSSSILTNLRSSFDSTSYYSFLMSLPSLSMSPLRPPSCSSSFSSSSLLASSSSSGWTDSSSSIYCVAWVRYTDTLLLGMAGGVLRYNLIDKENRQSCHFYPHPRGKSVHDIVTCPHGSRFCFVSRGDSTITICDGIFANPPTEIHCMNGSTYFNGLEWSPEGHAIILVTKKTEIIFVDTNNWKYRSCGQLVDTRITSSCWLHSTAWMFASNSPSCPSPDISTINFSISSDGDFVMSSLTPSNYSVDMNHILDTNQGQLEHDISSELGYCVNEMVVDPSGKILALTFKERSDSMSILPFVGVFVFQSKPFIALTLIDEVRCPIGQQMRRSDKYIRDDIDGSSIADNVSYSHFLEPQSMEFLYMRKKGNAQLAIAFCDFSSGIEKTELLVKEISISRD